jgi:hypothetical protein
MGGHGGIENNNIVDEEEKIHHRARRNLKIVT